MNLQNKPTRVTDIVTILTDSDQQNIWYVGDKL